MGAGWYLNPCFFISLGSSQHTSKGGQICNIDRNKKNSSANSTRYEPPYVGFKIEFSYIINGI